MIPPSPTISNALSAMRTMLQADGYELELGEDGPNVLVAEIKAGPDACAECLVPKDLMRAQFERALHGALEFGLPEIRLIYPTDG